MFADYIKMAAKIAAIIAGVALIIVLLNQVTIPTFDVTLLATAVGKGKAILAYYLGDFLPLFYVGIALITLRFIFIPGLRIALIPFRIIMKSNE